MTEFQKRMTGLDPLATIFDKAVDATTSVLDDNIGIEDVAVLKVMVSEDTGVIFSMELTRNGVTKVISFNGGVALSANAKYTFEVTVRPGDSVNFQFGAGTTINVLNVDRM